MNLTPIEQKIVDTLKGNPGVVQREKIISRVFNIPEKNITIYNYHNLRVCIHRIRKKLGKGCIITSSYIGYAWSWEAKPTIVCLCGSTRFSEAFQKAQLEETLAGKIVLTIGCNTKSDDIFSNLTKKELKQTKSKLDELHLRKIDLADEVLILNVGGYIGESTARELAYARKHSKKIRFLEG